MPNSRDVNGSFLLVAVFAVYSFFTGSPQASVSDDVKGGPLFRSIENTSSAATINLQSLLTEYFGHPANESTDYTINFIIALVPDPVDSHAGWLFDPFLDAIQRAAESGGYVLDRYKIPWEMPKHAAKEKSLEAAKPNITEEEHRRSPGIVLFRDNENPHDLLVVFLVGEIPTSGVHQKAFLTALEQIHDLRQSCEFKVLGPTFSGSISSLKIAIQAWIKKHEKCEPRLVEQLSWKFRFISGSATSIDKTNFETSAAQETVIELDTTTVSEAELLARIFEYLTMDSDWLVRSGLHRRGQIAILTEANTAFGRSIQGIDRNYLVRKLVEQQALEKADKEYANLDLPKIAHLNALSRKLANAVNASRFEEAQSDLMRLRILSGRADGFKEVERYLRILNKLDSLNPQLIPDVFQRVYGVWEDKGQSEDNIKKLKTLLVVSDFLQLPFPLHTARVRTAYEKGIESKNEETNAGKNRRNLALSLEDDREPVDVLPSLHPAITSNVSDEMISSILTSVSREQVNYVGLFATDTRDKLFLAKQVRQYCPNVRLFTTEADILYSHSDVTKYTRGMLVASTYPLINLNQEWTRSPSLTQQRLQFPSGSAQGTYNATIALLNEIPRKGELLEYGSPATRSDNKHKTAVPPVWISVVGNGGLWPVTFVSHFDTQLYTDAKNPAAYQNPQPPVSYFLEILMVLFSLFAAIHAIGTFTKWRVMRILAIDSTNSGNPERLQMERFQLEQKGFVLGLLFLLLLCEVLLARVAFIAKLSTLRSLIVFPGALLLLISGFRVAWSSLMPKTGRSGSIAGLLLFATWNVGVILLFYLLFNDHNQLLTNPNQEPWDRVFYYLRAANPLSGLSPVSPILFLSAAIYMFLLLQLKRIYLMQTFNLSDEVRSLDLLALGGVGKLPTNMEALLNWSAITPLFLRDLFRLGKLRLMLIRYKFLYRILRYYAFSVKPNSIGWPPVSLPAVWEKIKGIRSGFMGVNVLGLIFIAWNLRKTKQRELVEDAVDKKNLIARISDASLQIKRLDNEIEGLSNAPSLSQWYFWPVLFVAVYYPVKHVYERFLPTFEGVRFDFAFLGALVCVYVFVLVAAIKLLILWKYTKELLARLASHSTAEVYSRLPEGIAVTLGGRFYIQRPTLIQLSVPVEQLKKVGLYPLIEKQLKKDLSEDSAASDWSSGKTHNKWLSAFETVSQFRHSPDAKKMGSRWNDNADESLAMRAVFVVREIFMHLRNYLAFATAGMLLMLFAVTSYPFQPMRLLVVIICSLILVVVSCALTILIQIGRDEILSRVSRTKANQISWDRTFITRILIYVVFPLLTAFATQFPEIGGFVHSWLEPIQRAFR